MKTEAQIRPCIEYLLNGLESYDEQVTWDVRRAAGMLEAYLYAVNYLPAGTYGDLSRVTLRKMLWHTIEEREGYVTCMMRHARNYLEGIPFEKEQPK